MKLLDANILLYAYDISSVHHRICRTWFERILNAEEIIALPWQTILAFIRIATNSRAVQHPLSAQQACSIVTVWLEHPKLAVIAPEQRFWGLFREQVVEAQVTGALITDAALAALALEHGATLCSTDRDFRRFRGLKLLDPTQAGGVHDA